MKDIFVLNFSSRNKIVTSYRIMNKNIVYGLIGFGYLLIGILTWKYEFFGVKLDPTQAMLFGILFIIYGAFRVYRAIKLYKDDQKN
ncbi:hypothetical protein SAMN05443634_103130 [Chishuiella changwenlii]|uniref:Uncharacterized protein n=1 Tax=Chishuiella changwenlii TaxID=1434701 RepID=A0A1M6UZR2_9FLAO|nr:hypothetical protein [Chishuiella changwenlii]GGF02259.1 hypothetical protein GCM10010984_19690 [Chishuiella changwenlii]SHK74693.1 hypothetical protein SAMN05443634_103130 [Chishuiella changwenlii]